jgi:hypothetical protein
MVLSMNSWSVSLLPRNDEVGQSPKVPLNFPSRTEKREPFKSLILLVFLTFTKQPYSAIIVL